MNPRTVATVHAAGRAVVGGALVAAPRGAIAPWIGADAARGPVTVVARALGVRDCAIGLGLLSSLSDPEAARRWAAAGLASDAVDLAATLAVRDELPKQGVLAVAAIAGGSLALGAWLLFALD